MVRGYNYFFFHITGAKKEGAWGAIKGFSKGIVGVVLRPTAGILDLTSATFNAVQKYVLIMHHSHNCMCSAFIHNKRRGHATHNVYNYTVRHIVNESAGYAIVSQPPTRNGVKHKASLEYKVHVQ